MVKKTYKNTANKKDKFTTKNSATQKLSQKPTFTTKNYNTDDIILSLSSAYENKRARQVVKWEQAQRRNMSQSI